MKEKIKDIIIQHVNGRTRFCPKIYELYADKKMAILLKNFK